jgi:hypothetical protein
LRPSRVSVWGEATENALFLFLSLDDTPAGSSISEIPSHAREKKERKKSRAHEKTEIKTKKTKTPALQKKKTLRPTYS